MSIVISERHRVDVVPQQESIMDTAIEKTVQVSQAARRTIHSLGLANTVRVSDQIPLCSCMVPMVSGACCSVYYLGIYKHRS